MTTARSVPGIGEVRTSGVVTQVVARHEGTNYGSDVFLVADGVLPALVQEVAEVTTTRVEPECYVPPRPGAEVRRATGEERAQALYFDQMDRKVPVGQGPRRRTRSIVNLEFLDGTRGGHVSISGISGVATKTSFALFLLYSIFQSGVLGKRSVNAKALVFSVKGEDLLFLDHRNRRLDGDLVADYAELGLPAGAFASTGFYAPPTPDDPSGRPFVAGRTTGVTRVLVDARRVLRRRAAALRLRRRRGRAQPVHDGDPHGGGAGCGGRRPRSATARSRSTGQILRTYDALVEFVSERLTDEDARRDWAGPVTGTGTVNAFLRRLRSSLKPLRGIVRGDLPDTPGRRVTTEGRQVTVVDLHNLPERAQRFVVGVVLAAETARKEAAGASGLLFTMIDELNKYAPREGSSPIKEVLLDIAERGRSLGIILIGAQQTASEVERRIVANSSVKVVGRLDPAEAGRPEYGFLPPSQRTRATLAKPGTMFVSQPEIPVPLAVEFPFPAWATRLSESAGEAPGTNGTPPRDPFARLASATEDDDAPF